MADDFRISELVTLAPAAIRAAARGIYSKGHGPQRVWFEMVKALCLKRAMRNVVIWQAFDDFQTLSTLFYVK